MQEEMPRAKSFIHLQISRVMEPYSRRHYSKLLRRTRIWVRMAKCWHKLSKEEIMIKCYRIPMLKEGGIHHLALVVQFSLPSL